MKHLILLLTIVSFFSCKSHTDKEKDNLILSQEKKIEDLEKKVNKVVEQKTSKSIPAPINKLQYYFVVLDVEEKHMKVESLFYTSAVNEISQYNETIKYKILDAAVSNYKNSADGMAWNGSVKNRRIFLFDTYEAASQAREKYIMQ